MKFPVVLSDMDDTVLIHEVFADELWRRIVAESGFFDHAQATAVSEAIIKERHELWNDPDRAEVGRRDMTAARREFVSRALRSVGNADESRGVELVESFNSEREASVRFPESSRKALVELSDLGLHLVLITNGGADSQRHKIERFGLDQYFDIVLIEGEVGIGKPHREIYELGLQPFGVDPTQAIMVGDNWDWEVVAPAQFGMATIWVRRTAEPNESEEPPGFLGRVKNFESARDLIVLANRT